MKNQKKSVDPSKRVFWSRQIPGGDHVAISLFENLIRPRRIDQNLALLLAGLISRHVID